MRSQQIFAAEAFAAVVAPFNHEELFRSRNVLWFVDNESACSSLIRGSSRVEDVGNIAAAAHVLFLKLGCRVCFEWIDSASNPADGLSRAGCEDPWTVEQGWRLGTAREPSWTEEWWRDLASETLGL